jgi:hypothetical protein
VNTAPIAANSWTYYYSTVAAPDGIFQRDFADAVVKADPPKFRLVDPSQYRTTD